MFSYTAYGLGLQSAVPLPELMAGATAADVVIRCGKVAVSPPEPNGPDGYVRGTVEAVFLFQREVGTFLVRGGHEIIVDPASRVEERALRRFILGPALSVLLHQKGLLVFHASVIAFASGAVAFAARKGGGKSTMAAALHVRGHGMVADDIMALDAVGDCLMVRPGFPQVKLWPDAVEAIGEDPASLPRLGPDLEKRVRPVSQGFAVHPLPLRCVFVCSVGQELEIVPLRSAEALLSVMPHWYGALFRGALLPILGLETHFRQCAHLVENIPVYHLQRPHSLAALPDVTRIVEEYLWTCC
jgi:hypothetical protein